MVSHFLSDTSLLFLLHFFLVEFMREYYGFSDEDPKERAYNKFVDSEYSKCKHLFHLLPSSFSNSPSSTLQLPKLK